MGLIPQGQTLMQDIIKQLSNTTMLQPRERKRWRLESSMWAWTSNAHTNTDLEPRSKPTLFVKLAVNSPKENEWKICVFRRTQQRSNVYVYHVKNADGVRSLSRTHSAIIISQVKTHQTMPIQGNSSSTVECENLDSFCNLSPCEHSKNITLPQPPFKLGFLLNCLAGCAIITSGAARQKELK